MDQMPAVIRKDHLDEHVTGEHLALDVLLAGVGDLGDGLHRDVDLFYQIRHLAVFRCLHYSGSDCVFITGIGMNYIPFCFFSHAC